MSEPTAYTELVVVREEVSEAELAACGVDIDRDFAGSSLADFRKYPAISEGGWHIVIKHQPTLTSVSREPWDLLGPIKLVSDGLDIY